MMVVIFFLIIVEAKIDNACGKVNKQQKSKQKKRR